MNKQYIVEEMNVMMTMMAKNMFEEIDGACDLIYNRCILPKEPNTLYMCGNGGSGANASHLANDFQKGLDISTFCLNDNVALITAYANDVSYTDVFGAQLNTVVRGGDILIVLSGSGRSPNILNALETADGAGAYTIGMYGSGASDAVLSKTDVIIEVPSANMQIIEDMHLTIGHYMYHKMKGLSHE